MEKQIQKIITSDYDEENILKKDKPSLLRKIRTVQERELNKLYDKLIKDSEKVLGVQADLYKDQLEKVFKDFSDDVKINRVEDSRLKKLFEKSKLAFDSGEYYTISSFWSTFYDSVRGKTIQNIESAYLYEKTKKDFLSDLNSSFKTNEGQLDAVARTLIENAWLVAMIEMENVNGGLIKGYQYNAILDERTSDICRSLNGGVWIEGNPELSTLDYPYRPSLHYRCRSFITPLTKSWLELGLNPDNLTDEDIAFLSGNVPAKQTYYQWFENQTERMKRDILGSTRYNAYKKGNLKIEQFYNNGRKININTLRARGLI